jgi:uncharacterized membrane-anchored protein
VGGAIAKKAGLLAIATAFFAKFAKLILAGVVIAGGGIASLFKRKK